MRQTRKVRAKELLERLERGPSFSEPFDSTPFTPELAEKSYHLWSRSWILNDLQDLIPELRKEKRKGKFE